MTEEPVIYGADDRREYYQTQGETLAGLFEAHAVALIDEHWMTPLLDRRMDRMPKWRELDGLCPDEPFSEQPSVAFCSGVLALPGLVLTAEHCLDLIPIERIRVVFGYYYIGPNQLALEEQDVHGVTSVVSKSTDSPDLAEFDFAWLRIDGNPRAPHAPARRAKLPARAGDTIVTVSAGGGAPLKVDANGKLRQLRMAAGEAFVVDSDMFRGSSGAGAFNLEGALVGTFTTGRTDFQATEGGCRRSARHDASQAEELFTSVDRAFEGPCRMEPRLAPCAPEADRRSSQFGQPSQAAHSCAASRFGRQREGAWMWFLVPMLLLRRICAKVPGPTAEARPRTASDDRMPACLPTILTTAGKTPKNV
ncbi:MAG TPA: serine protease [Polyangiaceae bacterium]|nr:serine protease [Polyangiaceae bacterium]